MLVILVFLKSLKSFCMPLFQHLNRREAVLAPVLSDEEDDAPPEPGAEPLMHGDINLLKLSTLNGLYGLRVAHAIWTPAELCSQMIAPKRKTDRRAFTGPKLSLCLRKYLLL